ncbi:MAG: Holliday junction resolvase RuvX [candidate division WOR-3 bacterium]
MKVMAIDYGRTKIGIALTDPLGIIAQPYLSIPYISKKGLIKRLKCICEENSVGLILVGNPLRHNGKDSEMSGEIKKFAYDLKKLLKIKVHLWDERFTSQLATKVLKDHSIKSKNLDQISASLMLEEFLKQKNDFSKEC